MSQPLLGTDEADTLEGGESADTIYGFGANDLLRGRGGDDLLLPGTGADTLDGGQGIDTASYAGLGAVGVSLLEGGFGGAAFGDVFLGVENLIGTGFADTLIGSAFANRLRGEAGNDVLAGLGGNDLLEGGDGADSLAGGAGADTLDGGAGADTMRGGVGDDLYIVESAADRVIEGLNGGADTVIASLDLTLAPHVEALVLAGAAANGTGNPWANLILGNALANVLTGAAGADTLIGGLGADTLRGGNGDDALIGGPGNDRLEGGQGWDRIVSPFALDEVALLRVASGAIRMTDATGVDLLFSIEELDLAGTVWRPAPATIAIGFATPWHVRTSRLDGPPGSQAGYAVAGAGDVDGDGHADLLIGAPGADGGDGAAWLVWGRVGGFGARFDIADGSVRFINGAPGQGAGLGTAVAGFGDVDGDGRADLGIGAPGLPAIQDGTSNTIVAGGVGLVAGRDRAVFQQGDGSVRIVNAAIADGTSNTILFGEAVTGEVGGVTAAAGDLNGDGLADIAIGGSTGAGYVSILLGSAGRPQQIGLGATDGAVTRISTGLAGADQGVALGGGGDVNGDGFDDLVIGAAAVNGGAGGAWVLLGKAGGWGGALNLGGGGFLTVGPLAAGDALGTAAAVLGDVNGDGIADFALGAPGADGGRGAVHVVFGRAGLASPIALDAPSGVARIAGLAPGDGFGARVAAAGDVNGDGLADIIVGGLDGEAWLVLGRSSFAGGIAADAPGVIRFEGENGFFGRAVAAAGDLDGDGLDDLIIGSATDGGGLDSSWVIHGDRWLVI